MARSLLRSVRYSASGCLSSVEADAVARLVDLDDLDGHRVAALDDVLDRLDALALLAEPRDVEQAVGALLELDEGAEVGGLDDRAGEHVADLDLLGHRLDAVHDAFRGLLVGGADEDRAVVLDVDVGAELLGHAADGLAALADDEPDLVGVDLDA